MKKFENVSKVHNLFAAALIAVWFADLVFTIVGAAKGWPTMTSVEHKFVYLNGIVDLLWLFALSIELTLSKAVAKLYRGFLHIVEYLIDDAENQSKAVNERVEEVKE